MTLDQKALEKLKPVEILDAAIESNTLLDIEICISALGTNGRVSPGVLKEFFHHTWGLADGALPVATIDKAGLKVDKRGLKKLLSDEILELINEAHSFAEIDYYLDDLIKRKSVSRKLIQPFYVCILRLATDGKPMAQAPSSYADDHIKLMKFSELDGSGKVLTVYAIAWYIS